MPKPKGGARPGAGRPIRGSESKVQLNLQIQPSAKAQLKTLAQLHGVSLNQMIENLILDYSVPKKQSHP